jgi:hypothetical protein
MNIMHTDAYRAAFLEYLRKGTPIRLAFKEAATPDRYVWRTQRDTKVRLSHRRNDGRVFRWADPPETGHPGEGFNCRCEAVPYIEGQTEFAFFDLRSASGSGSDRWDNNDFIWHFYVGDGQEVTLEGIGHLPEIIEQYAYRNGAEGAHRRLAGQIAEEARSKNFPYDFGSAYQFEGIEFSHGRATVQGQFDGTVTEIGDMLRIEGTASFYFLDRFTDPVDLRAFSAFLRESPDRLWRLLQHVGAFVGIGEGPQGPKLKIDEDDVSWIFMFVSELGGTAYPITGEWKAGFLAQVFKDRAKSNYSATQGQTR